MHSCGKSSILCFFKISIKAPSHLVIYNNFMVWLRPVIGLKDVTSDRGTAISLRQLLCIPLCLALLSSFGSGCGSVIENSLLWGCSRSCT